MEMAGLRGHSMLKEELKIAWKIGAFNLEGERMRGG